MYLSPLSQWKPIKNGTTLVITALLLAACTFKGSTRVVYLKPGQIQVLPGDTLASVALRHQVGIRELVQCNQLKPPFSLKGVGVLTLPNSDQIRESSSPSALMPQDASDIGEADGPTLVQADQQVQWSSMEDEEQQETPDNTSRSPKAAAKQSIIADVAHDNKGVNADFNDDNDGDDVQRGADKKLSKNKNALATVRSRVVSDTEIRSEKSTFIKPVSGSIKRAFNAKKSSDGMDFATRTKAAVQAVASGTVVHAGPMTGENGSMVLIKHADGWSSCYRSLDGVKVKANQKVSQGDIVGATKSRTLRFDLRQNRKPVNPLKHLGS